jgi:hypothetical protein
LNDDELSAYQQFSAVLDGMDLHNDNHGYSSEGKPNTRFYLSLKDGLPAIEFMTTFVGQLDNMYRNGSIPFFQSNLVAISLSKELYALTTLI